MSPAKSDRPTTEAYAAAAWLLRCEEAAMRAVADVECGAEGAFLDSGEPVVLFEPHVFHRLTGGRFDGRTVPGVAERWGMLSYDSWRPGWYGPVSAQHRRLAAAAELAREEALQSASWGLFQLLGENHARCGYPDLQRFVNAMYREADDHLRAFAQFVRYSAVLVDALRARDWPTFARLYNGPGFASNKYDQRLAAAYAAARSGLD